MKRLLVLLFTGCASTQLTTDFSAIEHSVSTRTALSDLTLPAFDEPDDVHSEVERLLAKPLTLEAAVRIALLTNREARAALADVGIARGDFVQAGLLPNPEVEFEVREPGGPQPAQIDLGLEYSISGAVLAPLRASVAEAQLEAAKLRAAGALIDLTYSTKLAFLEAQAQHQRLTLRLRALESQQASYATAVELSRVGNLTPAALANELAAVELSRVQVAEAENALLDAKEALTRALGLSGSRAQWTLDGNLGVPSEPPSIENAEAKAVASSLELLELKQRLEAASRKVSLAQTEGWLPHLSGGFHGERDGALWELGAHVTVGLPVFDRAQGKQLSARSEYDALRSRTEGFAVSLRSSVRATLNRAESASRRARHYAERIVPARQRQLEQTVLEYNAMTVGVFHVLQVQRGVTDGALAQVDATLDAWKARVALDVLLAGRSTPLRMTAVPTSTSSATSAAAH